MTIESLTSSNIRSSTNQATLAQTATARGRKARNMAALMWMISAVLVALIPLTLLIIHVVRKGYAVVVRNFPHFWNDALPTITTNPGGGIRPAIIGTFLMTGAAALLAIPLGVMGAIYLNEYGKDQRFAKVLRFFAEVMSGVPSIVMGLFIYTIYTLKNGFSGFGGAMALACLMLPIVIRSSEEMLKLVPNELRQASLALGCPQWRAILTVILPAAAPGVISGAMLAVARAAGETAPLLFTVGLVYRTNFDLFNGPNTALPQQIYANATAGPFPAPQERAWGAALTLILIVMLCSVAARLIGARFSTAQQT